MSAGFKNFAEFWPYYLGEHAKPTTRALHFAGTGAGLLLTATALISGQYWLLLVALVCGYGPAWVGHFFVPPRHFSPPAMVAGGGFSYVLLLHHRAAQYRT